MEEAVGDSPERASGLPPAGRHRSPAAPLEASLSRLVVGMWASRRHRACQLLLLPEQQQLVVLVSWGCLACCVPAPAPPHGPYSPCMAAALAPCTVAPNPAAAAAALQCDRRTTGTGSVRPSPSRFSLAAGLTAKSPFASGHAAYRHAGCVHAFEIPFCSIRGIQYDNP